MRFVFLFVDWFDIRMVVYEWGRLIVFGVSSGGDGCVGKLGFLVVVCVVCFLEFYGGCVSLVVFVEVV